MKRRSSLLALLVLSAPLVSSCGESPKHVSAPSVTSPTSDTTEKGSTRTTTSTLPSTNTNSKSNSTSDVTGTTSTSTITGKPNGASDQSSSSTNAGESQKASSKDGSTSYGTSARSGEAPNEPAHSGVSSDPSNSTSRARAKSAGKSNLGPGKDESSGSSGGSVNNLHGGGSPVSGHVAASVPAAHQAGVTRSTPWSVSIPNAGLQHSISPIGASGGNIDPAPHTVNWYSGSASPGQKGISVILGHVTSGNWVPDVFWNVQRLQAGETFTTTDGSGTVHTWRIDSTASINKHQLQTDPRIWGSSSTPKIALVTCDSNSRVNGSHHVNNFVVFASKVG